MPAATRQGDILTSPRAPTGEAKQSSGGKTGYANGVLGGVRSGTDVAANHLRSNNKMSIE